MDRGEKMSNSIRTLNIIMISAILFFHSASVFADNPVPPEKSIESLNTVMNNTRLGELLRKIDPDLKAKPGYWELQIQKYRITIITDERADRMRIITPIVEAKDVGRDLLYRLMQANFDSALDARYSIAKNIIWSTFIHPLSNLEDREFLVALGQVVNLVQTYGSSFSSGALTFRGGDSSELRDRELIDELIRKGLAI